MTEYPPIHTLVPHSGSMLLLDRLIAYDEHSLTAAVTVHDTSPFVCDGVVGAWFGLEYMAQAVAAFAGRLARADGLAPKLGFLLGTRRFVCSAPHIRVGTTVVVTVVREWQDDSGLGSFRGVITSDMFTAEATVTVFQPPNIEQFLLESRA